MDKELLVLSAVEHSPETSQRELACRTGLSLGTINILMKKMIREGLIKLEKLPSDRAVYMVTPKGIEEKIIKTQAYITWHYQALERMRGQLRLLIGSHRVQSGVVAIDIEQQELRELLLQVIDESGVPLVNLPDMNGNPSTVILTDRLITGCDAKRVINIHEHINP